MVYEYNVDIEPYIAPTVEVEEVVQPVVYEQVVITPTTYPNVVTEEVVTVRSTEEEDTDWLLIGLIIAVGVCTICSVFLLFCYTCCRPYQQPQYMPAQPQYGYEQQRPVYVMPGGDYSQDMSIVSKGNYYSGQPEKFIRLDSAGSHGRGSYRGAPQYVHRQSYVSEAPMVEVVHDDGIRL